MRKSARLLSLLLALLLAVSCFSGLSVVSVSAAEEQKVYFDFPTDGTWGDPTGVKVQKSGKANVYVYVYPIYGNETDITIGWQVRAAQCTSEGDNVYSFDLSTLGTIEEGADYGISFSTAANGGFQTVDMTMTAECIGDHIYVTPYNGVVSRENSMDSHKVDYYAAWRTNTQCGPKATISSLGQLMPGLFPFYQPKAQQLSYALKGYLTNPINNAYFQYDNNMTICEGLGVTPRDVYNQYVLDNADIIEASGGEVLTSDDIPCPYITDGTTKIASLDYVKQVLGVEDEEPTTAAPTEIYSVIGSNDAVFGGVWWAEYTGTEMTYDSADGLYKITFAEVEPQKMLQLKVIKDHDQNLCWPETGGNYTFDVNSLGDITVTFDPETGEINVLGDITLVTSIDIDSIIAVGNGEDTYLNGANWDPCDTSNAMTEVSDGVWEITMEDIYAFDNYQIKFAANSVDADDNPVSNPWGINWGAENEALYPTGEPIPAVFNGKNCIFEVEEDESVVKVQLDLRNFDYSTKEGAVFTITVIPPEPEHVHTPGAAARENEVPATCTEAGSYDEVVRCTECGEIISSTHKTINKLAHTPGAAARENEVPATCAKAGSYDEVVRCTECGEIISSTHKTINKLAHTPGTPVKENVVQADCENAGSYDNVVYCTECNEIISTEHKTTAALGHAAKYVAGVPATETSEGMKGHYECTRCNKLFLDAAATKPVTAADLVIPKIVPATVEPTTAEPTTPDPTVPPVVGDTFTVNAKSNIYTSDSKEYTEAPETVTVTYYADITGLRLQATQFTVTFDPSVLTFNPDKNGYYDADDEEYNFSAMFPIAGDNGQINVIDNSTIKFAIADANGLRLRRNNMLVPIAKINFDVAPGAKGATDVNLTAGILSFMDPKTDADYVVCSVAGGLNQENLNYVNSLGSLFAVAGHREVVDKGYDATCTETGLTDGIHCELCGEVIKAQEVIPAKGHTAVTDPAVPATCTTVGKTAGSHCSVCNEVIKAQSIIPAKGHTVVNDPAVPATCTTPGLTAGSHCSVCDEVIVAQTTVPAKGHTVVNDPAVPATCTTPGKTAGSHCSVCNEVIVAQSTVPAKGHTIVTNPAVPATCTAPGKTAGSHCSVCNEVIVAQTTIPALGHDTVTVPGKPATYTETGLTDGIYCNRCKEWIVPQEIIPMLKPAYKIGDVNRDGSVDVLDAVMIQKYCVDKVDLDSEQIYVGDVNDDGVVDVLDAIMIQKYSVDKVKEFTKKA